MARREKQLLIKHWMVDRTGAIDEIIESDDSVKWRVEVWDGNRNPFVTRYFNTKEAAFHFLSRLMKSHTSGEEA